MNAKLIAQWGAAALLVAAGVTYAGIGNASGGGMCPGWGGLNITNLNCSWGSVCYSGYGNDNCLGFQNSQGQDVLGANVTHTAAFNTQCVMARQTWAGTAVNDTSNDGNCTWIYNVPVGGYWCTTWQ